MERQHAEGRGRRDRRTREFFAFLGRAFPGRIAGADLPAFLHETSIVIRETWLLRIANKILVIHFLRFLGFIRAQ
jgi:hypothetical protein